MDSAHVILALALAGAVLVAACYRHHAKELLKLLDRANAERRDAVQQAAEAHTNLINALHDGAARLNDITATARHINGRNPS